MVDSSRVARVLRELYELKIEHRGHGDPKARIQARDELIEVTEWLYRHGYADHLLDRVTGLDWRSRA